MINFFTKKHAACLFLWMLFIGSFLGNAKGQITNTISFESATIGNLNNVAYQEAGFTLEDGSLSEFLQIIGPEDGYPSKTIFNLNFDRIIRLRKTDNTVFDLASFDYAGGRWGEIADAVVTGFLQSGGTVTTNTSSGSKTYTNLLLNWKNLTKVEINFSGGTSTSYGALDNFAIGSLVQDGSAPSIPTGLSSSAITAASFILSWTASTDNVALTGYEIFVDGILKGTSATTSFNVTGLSASTVYAISVKAKDAAGNLSMASIILSVTTSGQSLPGVINIDKNIQYQRIDGFGAFGGKDAAWSSNPLYDDNFNNLVVNDLGSNIVRIEVSNTLEMINDNASAEITDTTKFSITANNTNSCDGSGGPMSKWIDYIKAIKQKADDNAEPLKVIASFWTPPIWMKYLECQFGTDNTWNRLSNGVGPMPGIPGGKADMRYEFAEFCSVYIKLFKKHTGFDLFAISLQNEPAFAQPYQSCVYSPEQLADIIKIVGNRFKQEGITVKIFGPEDVQSQDRMLTYLNAIGQDATARENMNIAAIHGYGNDGISSSSGTVANWKQTYATAQKYNWPLWMTETSGYSQDWTPTGAINLAKSMHLALKYGKISGWVYWQLSEPGGSSFTLLNAGQHSPLSYISKNYFRYIRPGAVQVESNVPNDGAGVTAFLHHANKTLTIELLNDGIETKAYSLNITGGNIPANFTSYRTSSLENCINTGVIASTAIITLPPKSLTTLVGTTILADATLPVSILSQPKDTTVNPGDLVVFSVIATGTPGLTYQWRRNNVIITGATAPTYQVVATNADNGAEYSVVVSNEYGAPVTSSNAILRLNSFAGLSIPFIATEPVIDGEEDIAWNSIPYTPMTKKVIGNLDPAVFSGSFKAAWDNTNLYLYYNITDATIIPSKDDDVEFFFNGLNNKPSGYGVLDYQYRFVYNNTPVQETKHNKIQGVVYQQMVVTGGYTTEVKIPWTTLGVVPVDGKLLGMDFAADNINNIADGRNAKIAWNTDNNDIWYNPSYMGTGMLIAGTLPVQLLSFKATHSGTGSLLSWSTASESSNKGFYVEHSLDGLNFSTVSFVSSTAINGNSNMVINYQLLHQQIVKGLNFYRLKQEDKNGKITYSNVVKLQFSSTGFNVLNITPNPVTANHPLNIVVASARKDDVTLQVMDAAGRVLLQNAVKVQQGNNNFNLNTQALPAGFYYLKITGSNKYENATQRFVKE